MNDCLLIGVSKIDHQHAELFRSFERLTSIGNTELPDEILSEVLSKLSSQINHHFATEEEFMAGLALPEPMLTAHHAAHQQILEELTQIHLDAMHGKALYLPEIIACVSLWVRQHLAEFDLGLTPYIRQFAKSSP